jgi:methionyl-tRNA synthetase
MSEISIEDFKKLELRTAKVLDAQEIPGADKLWRLLIDAGSEKKEIVAGIKPFYSRQALIGKNIILVNNLAKAIIRGVESSGMLLAAKEGSSLSLLTIDKELPPGSAIG